MCTSSWLTTHPHPARFSHLEFQDPERTWVTLLLFSFKRKNITKMKDVSDERQVCVSRHIIPFSFICLESICFYSNSLEPRGCNQWCNIHIFFAWNCVLQGVSCEWVTLYVYVHFNCTVDVFQVSRTCCGPNGRAKVNLFFPLNIPVNAWFIYELTNLTLNILLIWSISDFPGHKAFIVRNSANIHPTDQRSMAVEYSYNMQICTRHFKYAS